ncbi:MAG: GIY-YIG nuclease family protein [Candidatus Omnitrophica bacterium]|nr:GIY-YIG nuclease family protein [Candidatus Omnitrophota bacterium]MDD5553595.1 GIY-YIG nuclease family protein [Candidatus Omnitrophota bacterium]
MPSKKNKGKWCVYILECSDGKLYTGITSNLDNRIKQHNSGNGCKFTRCRIPIQLLYKKAVSSRIEALKQEFAIKRLPRKKKLELIG